MHKIHMLIVPLFYRGRHRKEDSGKTKPVVRSMVFALMIATLVTGVSLARYVTVGSMDLVSARVARFDVSVTHTGGWSIDNYNDVAAVTTGGNKAYTFTVTNNSEVATRGRLVAQRTSGNGVDPVVSPSGFFNLNSGESQNVIVTIYGDGGGNSVRVYVEYEQIN